MVVLNALGRRLLRQCGPLPLEATIVIKVLRPGWHPGTAVPCPDDLPVRPAGGSGPTAAIGGIYIVGGAGPVTRAGCIKTAPATLAAGTVETLDGNGDVVATQTVGAGQTFTIPLQPGTYTTEAALAGSDGTGPSLCESAPFTVTDGNQAPVAAICSGS